MSDIIQRFEFVFFSFMILKQGLVEFDYDNLTLGLAAVFDW